MISFAIFVVQLWLFTLIALAIHYASPRIGMAPLLFMVAGIIGLLNVIELNSVTIILSNGIVLRPGGHALVPITLLITLVIYIVNGTRTARITVLGIMSVQLLVFFVLMFLTLYIQFSSPSTEILGAFTDTTTFDLAFIRAMIASAIAFLADLLIIIIIYQGINNWLPDLPDWIAPGIALLVALWTDSILFNVLAFSGTSEYEFQIPSDVIIKSVAAALIWPFVSVYLGRYAPKMDEFVGPKQRHTLAILFRDGHRNVKVESLETELRISRSIYTQLTQNIEEIFWLIDVLQDRFIYVSPAYERITGYSVDPLYDDANNFLEIIHDDERQSIEDDILSFLTQEDGVEFRITRPNKVIRWLRARAFPIEDATGNIIRYAGIAEDNTERRQLTEKHFELALAKERMQILQRFISDASHDLKTPLSAMMLKISLLERTDDPERRAQLRGEIRERAEHLGDLINDLFTLSYIESHDRIEMETLDFNEIVTDAIKNIEPLAHEKGLQFTVDLTDEATKCEGNIDQISRVVSNLISNAVRYTEKGGVSVTTSIEDSKVSLYVTDTGIGIPQEQLGLVFERFFRSKNAKDTQDGTGLGLAIAKAISERHHGNISVDSVEGEGSTFTFQLPKEQPKDPNHAQTKRITQEIYALPPDY